MIPCDTKLNPSISQRYRRLAGPFTADEATLHASAADHLRKTGARIVTVDEEEGAVIWRLRSEMETVEETAIRLRSLLR